MMRRQWDAKPKAIIVFEELKASRWQRCVRTIRSAKPSSTSGATNCWPTLRRRLRLPGRWDGDVGAQKKRRGEVAMNRRPSLKVGQRNAPVLASILALKADQPFRGYRRIWRSCGLWTVCRSTRSACCGLCGLPRAGPVQSSVEGATDADAEPASPHGLELVGASI